MIFMFLVFFYSDLVCPDYDIIPFFCHTYSKCVLNATFNFNCQVTMIKRYVRRVDLSLKIRNKECTCTELICMYTKFVFT